MNIDIRLSTGFWHHPKTRKLAKRLGLDGVRSLQILWLWSAQNRPDGNLAGMDWEDIELAADWSGEERVFFDCCVGVWIDEAPEGYALHDWAEHNPWQTEAYTRSESARKAAKARWGNADASKEQKEKDAAAMRTQCANDAPASKEQCANDAPASKEQCVNDAPASKEQCANDAPALREHQMGNAPLLSSPEDKNKIKNILKPSIHTENEDPVRDTRSGQVGVGGEVASPVSESLADRRLDGNSDEPSVEFQELRDWYSAHCKPEGIMAGFIEFKQAKSARTWPGQSRVYDDLAARCESSKWKRGYGPSLATYLRTQGWTAPPERDEVTVAPRASPDMPRATTHKQKQEQERESLALMLLERRRSKNAQPRNDAGGHIDAAFAVLPAVGV